MKNFEKQLKRFNVKPYHKQIKKPDVLKPVQKPYTLAEKGVVGTRVIHGQIEEEQNPKYGSFNVRGYSGNAGLFHELYNSEPQVREAVDRIKDILTGGTWKINLPDELPEDPELRQKLSEWTKFQNGKLKTVKHTAGGFLSFIEHCATSVYLGFAIHELVYQKDSETDWTYIDKFAFREQHTVDGWVLDERGDQLVAVDFDPGWSSNPYSLNRSELILTNVNQVGNDFEGSPPLRAAVFHIEFARLLRRIAAVTAEKYGCPLITIDEEDSLFEGENAEVDQNARVDIASFVDDINALDGPVIGMPTGFSLNLHNAQGTMPDLLGLIEHCEKNISICFTRGNAIIGFSNHGSYALAESKQDEWIQSAFGYSRVITEPINKILRELCRDAGFELNEYPTLEFSLPQVIDGTKWIADLAALINTGRFPELPPALVRKAWTILGVPPSEITVEQEVAENLSQEVPEVEPDTDLAEASVEPMPEDLMSTKDAAERVAWSTNRIRKLCREGRLKFWGLKQKPSTWRVSLSELAELMRNER